MGEKMKSALEIAMEKYNINPQSMDNISEEMKANIAEVRSFYKSKKAELEIMFTQEMKKLVTVAPDEYVALKEKAENDYHTARTRLENEEKKKIEVLRDQS